MKERFEIRIIVMAVFFTSVLCGCMMEVKTEVSGPETKSGKVEFAGAGPALPADIIDVRIGIYEEFLERKDITDRDRETVGSLLDYYRKINAALDTPVSEDYYRKITHLLFDSMFMLEDRFLVKMDERLPPENK